MTAVRIAALVLLAPLTAAAQNLEAIPVPHVALDASAPHFAYNGRATTFKAIARGGSTEWVVDWDFEGDGTWDNTRTVTNRYDLSARFTYPDQATSTTFTARVRVTSGAETATAEYPV